MFFPRKENRRKPVFLFKTMNHPPRNALLDSLKAMACIAIVLHHLAFYGPLSHALARHWPLVSGFLIDQARLAVPMFLVLGGYLAAASLTPLPGRKREASAWLWVQQRIGQRYMRLVLPLVVALLLVMLATELARPWLDDPMLSGEPDGAQLLAHALLLHGVLGEESLSAGVWYVAIDFQLYVVSVLLFAWAQKNSSRRRWLLAWVVALVAASLLYFNRDAAWDNWALYFFGAYGLGWIAYWAAQARTCRQFWLCLALLVVLCVSALLLEWRVRIAVAAGVALLLAVALRWQALASWRGHPWLLGVGQMSYSVFLIHFALCILLNLAWVQLGLDGAWMAALALLLGVMLSLLAGQLLYRWVERRQPNWPWLLRWQIGLLSFGWLLRLTD